MIFRLATKLVSAGTRLRALALSQRFGVSPTDIYRQEFYKVHVDANQADSANDVAEAIVALFSPQSVIDIGCGNGLYLRALGQRNVLAVGCDGSSHGVRLCPPEVFVFLHNLKEMLVINRRFDLCLCLEVAEHIPSRYSQSLVRSCCNTSDTVIFSSAPVGQGGTDHINERSHEFWDSLFRKEQFMKSARDTEALQARFRELHVVHWLRNNTRVYRKV